MAASTLRLGQKILTSGAVLASATGLAWGVSALPASATPHASAKIVAVGAENEYANVIGQIGGKYVAVTAIMSNPNTDPHTFEASPSVARSSSAAQLVVQNGVGYDDLHEQDRVRVTEREAQGHRRPDAPRPSRTRRRTRTFGTPRRRCPRSRRPSRAISSALDPSRREYFDGQRDDVRQLAQALARRDREGEVEVPGAPVATTEPVGDYMLQAAGTDNKTPWTLQADIMNGVDPSPQDVTCTERALQPAQGKGLPLQPAGHRLAHRRPSSLTRTTLGSRSSASTRRCRPPATPTSPGCSQR